MTDIIAQPLTAQAFAPFGDVLDCAGTPDMMINQGKCGRYHDRAKLAFDGARAGISLFDGQPRGFPYLLDMLERHPLGSQAFMPLNNVPLLITVADDVDGTPNDIQAFLTAPGQAVNLHKGTWHGVLAPIGGAGKYAVVDRIGEGQNLEEFWLKEPVTIRRN